MITKKLGVKPEVAVRYLTGLAAEEKWEARAISLRQCIATIEELEAENERLRAGLKQANSGFEKYERKYYLLKDNFKRLTASKEPADV
jgi:predicted RNase H-like nuclease (RuvC/YqgF family)